MLADNGFDYHVLTNAAKSIKGVSGLTCEIGLRQGGGTKYIIDALLENGDVGRTHIALDPYGSLPYVQSESHLIGTIGPYPNDMMKQVMIDVYAYIQNKDINVLFFPLEDTEFFERFEKGVPIYHDGVKDVLNTYALVYFDGPHSLNSTMEETEFFAPRGVPGSIFVYDDTINYYDHSKIKTWLIANDWTELEVAATKSAYVKLG
jgi:hypothetical protein